MNKSGKSNVAFPETKYISDIRMPETNSGKANLMKLKQEVGGHSLHSRKRTTSESERWISLLDS